MNIRETDAQYIAHTYNRFPLVLTGGSGSVVTDDSGKHYIDMGTGIAVNTFGVADAGWVQAVTQQLSALQHTSNLYYSEPATRLAAALCERTGMKRVFFSNSGAEANECAIKVARKYAAQNHGTDRYVVITLKNSFHGRTVTTLAATGQDVFHKDFLPLTPGFVHVTAGDTEEFERAVADYNPAAIMMEVVQGEGGVMPLPADFVQAAVRIARERDILLIADEVQCGNGRTGKLYGYMHYGFTPDIVSTAKGLGGGLPIGATLLAEKVQDVLVPGDHGSTFGGNPACCAGALNILSRLDDTMLDGVAERSRYIIDQLSGAPGVRSISGLGLMLGIETEKDAAEVINTCMQRGVLVIRAKNKVRLLPALNIPWDLLERAVQVIKEACE